MSLIIDKYIKYQQEVEKNYGKNSVVLLMVGSFYEIYGIDIDCYIGKVEEVCKILNIQKTRRNKNLMCGFPCFALNKHLSKLLCNNFTISIYDQISVPHQKEKDHKLVNIFSPSTYIDEEIVENNTLTCIYLEDYISPSTRQNKLSAFISSIDLSTGKSNLYELYETDQYNIYKLIYCINPCEIILSSNKENSKEYYKKYLDLNELEQKIVHYRTLKIKDTTFVNTFLEKIFGKNELLSPIENIGLECYGDLLQSYIKLLEFAYEHDPYIIKRIGKPQLDKTKNSLFLNNDALHQLNLIFINHQQMSNIRPKFASIFDVINHTSTKMGERLLKERLLNPITDVNELEKRYNKIENMIPKYQEYKVLLKNILDIEKKYRKWVLGKLNPFEFANLSETFKNIIEILKIAKKDFNNIDENLIIKMQDFYDDYCKTFNIEKMKEYSLNNIRTSFFNEGVNRKIDNNIARIYNINILFKTIADCLSGFIEKDKTNLVRVQNTEKEGYYLTTTKKRWKEMDKDNMIMINYENKMISISLDEIKEKTLSNSVKLSGGVIDKYSNLLLKLNDYMQKLVKEKYLEKLQEYDEQYGEYFNQIVSIISEIDVIVSSASVSLKYNYSKPIIKGSKSFVNFKNLRHPLIERIQDDKEYITNDVKLNEEKRGILLYGLNSSGKSSLLRAIGTNIVLAQMGMFVSTSEFNYYPFTQLLTKISTIDNMYKGQSTFIVEMQELKNILEKSNERSMILCDELTSGTETDSATGLVSSALLHLINKKALFLFTTHLHSIIEFEEISQNNILDICHFDIEVNGDNIIYKRKLEKGSGKSLYGIEIAAALGLDKNFIKDAYKFRSKFQGTENELLTDKRSRYNVKIIMDMCRVCGNTNNLHTHHIKPQKLSNKNGFINHFHKNNKHNLTVLCESCHQKFHN